MSYTYEEAANHVQATLLATLKDQLKGLELVVPGFYSYNALVNVLWESPDNTDDLVLDKINLCTEVRHLPKAGQKFLNTTTRRVYSRTGYVMSEIYVPLSQDLQILRKTGSIVKSAFEGRRGLGAGSGIEFKNVHFRELGKVKGYWSGLVRADFEYQEALAED